MAKRDKAIRKLLAASANLRLADVLAGLDALGFDCYVDANTHWHCRHAEAGTAVTVCPPHGGPNNVLPAYIREAQKAARAVLAWQAEQEDADADP